MIWVLVAAVVWTIISLPVGIAIGIVIRLADEAELSAAQPERPALRLVR